MSRISTRNHDTDNTKADQHDQHDWFYFFLFAFIIVIVTSCGSTGDDIDVAEAEGDPAAVETTTTTTAPETTTTQVEATEATEAVAAVEANFELIGELDLTTEEINAMVAFVEQAAGRDFLRPPKIEVQSIEDFEAGLSPDPEVEAILEENAEGTARLYQALGYTDDGVDELRANLAALGQSTEFISGRYDPTDDVVYMPNGALVDDDFNAILVHELLHALDGQHVDLAALIDQLGELQGAEVWTDETFSITAVVEGRATAVQFEWMMANNVIPSQTDMPEAFNTVPAAAINAVILPYQLGAQSIMELGGAAETWDLYESFPASSEQMVFPDRIGTDVPIEVAAPQVEGEVFYEGTNGVEGMLVLGIGDTLEPAPALVFETLGAAEGWGGDYFIVSGDEAESCFTGVIVADTPEDLAEIESLFTSWTQRETSSPVTRSAVVDAGSLTITSCAPFNA